MAAESGGEPVSAQSASDGMDDGYGEHALPVRELTPRQEENAAAAAALLAQPGTADRDGDFTYRLLSDGTAALTGYGGAAEAVTIPLTLGGAEVTALAAQAFGPGVTAVTVHGNVLYIEEGAPVAAWQGSYAASWAQGRGLALSSMTEGVLLPGVIDMSDVLSRVTVLSDALVSMGALEARRLRVGDTFILNRGDGDESFFTVTAQRPIGGAVYLTVQKADIAEVYSYRVYEGVRTATHSFSGSYEAGVDDEVQAASEVFEQMTTESSSPYNTGSMTIPLGDKIGELEVSYDKSSTVTTAYRIVVENGRIVSGEMASEQQVPTRWS